MSDYEPVASDDLEGRGPLADDDDGSQHYNVVWEEGAEEEEFPYTLLFSEWVSPSYCCWTLT